MKYLMLIETTVRTPKRVSYSALIAISLFFSFSSFAQGDLMIFPKRIVFEGSKRAHEINLANSGKDSARYVLSVVQIRMNEDGSFENITEPDPGQNFADKFFRIFPRKVVLAPNEAQTVKIQLINTNEMKPGEYRSHLYIRSEEEKMPLGEKEPPADPSAISVKLVAVFGISIPVIILSGDNNTEVKLTDLSFNAKDTVPTVRFTFNREGNMSTYGDIAVNYISPDGKSTPVAYAKGLAVYTPTAKRHFNLALSQPAGINYSKGTIQVTYSYDATKNAKVAEERIALR